MEKYPFVRCINPRRILNPYTRETLVVECGSCPACSLRKSSVAAMKCKLESLSHKYSMFITLTYDNAALPRMIVKHTNRYKDDCGEIEDCYCHPSLVDVTQRLGTQGLTLGTIRNTYTLHSLSSKVELPYGVLPHLSKYDLQLFFKRLRRNLDIYYVSKFKTEAPKIRYYACGEYGPIHFRPHYHVVLWFSDDEIYKVIRQILYKSWTFGRIDCQKSKGQCSDYVAKYLNCSCALPDVFKERAIRPFSMHSSHLGEKILEVTREEIYENEFESVIKRSVPQFSVDSDVVLWRSLKDYYFPKCKGYATKSKFERLYSYKTFSAARLWTKQDRAIDQAKLILKACFGVLAHDKLHYRTDLRLVNYFIESVGIMPYDFEHAPDYLRAIYMELRTSKHFLEFVCINDENLCFKMLDKIDNFWKDNDMFNLTNQLQQQREFGFSDWFEQDYSFFYHNLGFMDEQFKKTKAYKAFYQVTHHNAENAVKHKKLNDANRYFINK